MAAKTSIEWAANADGTPGWTWNPVRALYRLDGIDAAPTMHKVGTHCVHASEGCRFCYAERLNMRGLPGNGTGLPYAKQSEAKIHIFLDERMLAIPLKRRKPTTYFLSSMTDVFADFVPDEMLDILFAAMALSPHHTFIVLTKRAERMREYVSTPRRNATVFDIVGIRGADGAGWQAAYGAAFKASGNAMWPLPNVWLGVSAEDQANADARIPHLLATPAAKRLVSCEPMLGPIDLAPHLYIYTHADEAALANEGPAPTLPYRGPETPAYDVATPRLDWVICGGESGPKARPMHPDWARSLRDQCATAGVPFFFKQWGDWAPVEQFDPTGDSAYHWDAERYGQPTGRGIVIGWDGKRAENADCPSQPSAYPHRVGKARAGRLLDGVEHNARPPFHEVAGRKGEAGLLATRQSASPGSQAE